MDRKQSQTQTKEEPKIDITNIHVKNLRVKYRNQTYEYPLEENSEIEEIYNFTTKRAEIEEDSQDSKISEDNKIYDTENKTSEKNQNTSSINYHFFKGLIEPKFANNFDKDKKNELLTDKNNFDEPPETNAKKKLDKEKKDEPLINKNNSCEFGKDISIKIESKTDNNIISQNKIDPNFNGLISLTKKENYNLMDIGENEDDDMKEYIEKKKQIQNKYRKLFDNYITNYITEMNTLETSFIKKILQKQKIPKNANEKSDVSDVNNNKKIESNNGERKKSCDDINKDEKI